MIPTSPIYAKRIAQRAQDAARRIGEKPTSVVFKRANGSTLPAQTVRLEVDNRATLASSAAGAAPRMNVIIYGVRGHPSLPDSDIKEAYRFNYGGDAYTIVDIILQLGEIQGIGIATG
jgi:hypothetical protein